MRLHQSLPFGQLIKEHRETQGLTLKRVADFLQIDQTILQKIEEGQRNLSETQIAPLSKLLKIDKTQLHVAFITEQILRVIRFDQIGLTALQIVEAEVKTYVHKNAHRAYQLEKMQSVFRNFQRVTKAYVYEQYDATEGQNPTKPITFAVELDSKHEGHYNLVDLQRSLKLTLNREVNIDNLASVMTQDVEDECSALALIYQKK